MNPMTCAAAAACLCGVLIACGDDSAQPGSGGGMGVGGAPVQGGNAQGGSAGALGPGPGPGAGGGIGVGGAGDGAAPPSPVPPPPVLQDSCDGLDQSSPAVFYVSADDSNSMASPARAREALQNGSAWFGTVRSYEFFNYYSFDYPTLERGKMALFAEADEGAEPGTIDLQLAVRAPDAAGLRRPMTLTFVLDVSGSMDGHGMDRERAAVLALASQLRAGDVVNIVTWSTSQNVVLANHVASGPNDSAVVAAAHGLTTGGATDLHAGLVAGYELAMQSFDVTRLNRLILMSDGVANVGETSAALIAEHAELGDDEGIYLVGIGTGPVVAYNDRMMDLVTDAGRGAYLYLDTPREAEHLLAKRFSEVMDVAARAVRLELTVPWYFQMKKFYGEHYSENPSEVKPQHLAPGDAMVLLQTLKACDPSLISSADPVSLIATWNTPITHEIQSLSLETTVGDLLAAPAPRMPKAKAIAAFTEALRSGQSQDLSRALLLVEAAQGGDDADLHQIEKLIRSHPSFGN